MPALLASSSHDGQFDCPARTLWEANPYTGKALAQIMASKAQSSLTTPCTSRRMAASLWHLSLAWLGQAGPPLYTLYFLASFHVDCSPWSPPGIVSPFIYAHSMVVPGHFLTHTRLVKLHVL